MYREAVERTEEAGDRVFLSGQVAAATGDIDALLTVGALLPVAVFVVLLVQDPSAAFHVAAALPIAAVSGGLAAARRRRRFKWLRIERRAGETSLTVDDKRLRFPLRLRGEQQTYKNAHWVFLQVVDGDGESILFSESRRRERSWQTDWPSDGIDKSLRPLAMDLRHGGYLTIVVRRRADEART